MNSCPHERGISLCLAWMRIERLTACLFVTGRAHHHHHSYHHLNHHVVDHRIDSKRLLLLRALIETDHIRRMHPCRISCRDMLR